MSQRCATNLLICLRPKTAINDAEMYVSASSTGCLKDVTMSRFVLLWRCLPRRAAVTRRDVAQQLNVWPISVGVRNRPLTPFMPASAVQLLRRLCQWIVSDSSQPVTQKRQSVTAAATAYDSNHFDGPSRHPSKWDMMTSDTTWQLWKLLVMNHHTVDLFTRIAMK